MLYETYGPFIVPRRDAKKGKVLDFDGPVLSEFWNIVDEELPGLSSAHGCYIFANKAGRGITPWYVGQTKNSFRKECFQHHKTNLYHKVFNDIEKGNPVMILVARCTPNGKLTTGQFPRDEAGFVEKLLISKALSKNPKLVNKQNTRFLVGITLPGILNNPRGKPSPGSKLLSSVLGTK